jgi:mannose-6-phosphate isomerase
MRDTASLVAAEERGLSVPRDMPKGNDEMTSLPAPSGTRAPAPVVLGPNRPAERPYRGGEGILRFRGLDRGSDPAGDRMPEDFVASATEVFAGGGVGLTVLPDGTTLRDAIAADPTGYLGDEHVLAYGDDPRLLVKLLDTRERLFAHYHPGTRFARDVLGRPSGKTEAWVFVAADGPAYAYLGFRREVSEAEVLDWFRRQDVSAMLAAMNRVDLAPGDTLHVPAGMPHSIGPGITLVELQQPVDLSILIEYDGFPGLDSKGAVLGLDVATALSDLDRSAVSTARLAELASSRPTHELGGVSVTALFPAEADAVFRADRIRIASEHGMAELDPGYAVVVALDGTGVLEWEGGETALAVGDTVLVPYASGATTLRGRLTVLRCRPPAPRPLEVPERRG